MCKTGSINKKSAIDGISDFFPEKAKMLHEKPNSCRERRKSYSKPQIFLEKAKTLIEYK
jgi:hypothetical protein